jgi:hypothetical protein
MSAKLPKSWPPIARDVLLDAAQFFYREMNAPFPVYDVNMDRAIEYANRELEGRQREIREEASSRWIHRWESGQLDAEMKKAIDATYGRLRRAERGLRSHARVSATSTRLVRKQLGRVTVRKKSPRQLDAEIAQTLSGRSR